MLPLQNTNIVAIATPSGAGAIGIIRISGPEAIATVSYTHLTLPTILRV